MLKVRLWTRSKTGVVSPYGEVSIPSHFPKITMRVNPLNALASSETEGATIELVDFYRDVQYSSGHDACDYIADWEPKLKPEAKLQS